MPQDDADTTAEVYSALLTDALKQLKEEFHEQKKDMEFSVSLGKIGFASSAENTIALSVDSAFSRDQLIDRGHAKLLQERLEFLLGREIKLEYRVIKRVPQQENIENPPSAFSSDSKKEIKQREKHSQLREDFTFDAFVPGDGNVLPYNAAFAISKNPGKTAYNPLFLYGGVGLGKTHLMQAIGNAIYNNFGGKVIYVSSESFTNEYTSSIKTNTTSSVMSKYRKADVFLLDDIHFLQNKNGTQEQIFYIFEALYNAHKQLVFVCDRHISELKGMTERLVSRFDSGVALNLLFPGYETRIAIIEKKLELAGNKLPKDVIDLIAKRVETNVRDLESCLKTLFAYADLIQKDITLEIAEEQLHNKFKSPRLDGISVETIQKVVANYFNISFSDMKGKKQSRSVTRPRHVAIYIARKLTELSFTELGYEFGGKHHTSIMTAYNKIENELHYDSSLDSTIQILERMIKEKKY
ncbi:MAG: chromosomal replication initiator protein DnaA [Treponemataceae bacterium]|nr:MAG: chromosomal replication initiator protein DnaA [Treponemataceae bacterium]